MTPGPVKISSFVTGIDPLSFSVNGNRDKYLFDNCPKIRAVIRFYGNVRFLKAFSNDFSYPLYK